VRLSLKRDDDDETYGVRDQPATVMTAFGYGISPNATPLVL